MATIDYKVLPDSILLVQNRAKVDLPDIVETMLVDTQGKTIELPQVTVYRPYWVASVLLDQKLQQLVKAEGAEFRDLEYNVRALRQYQWSIDSSMGLSVPENTSEAYFANMPTRRRTKSVQLKLV